MLWGLGYILTVFLSGICMGLILMTAQEGYEDETGFHVGRPPEKR